jgi:indole-3-glycerol phosphate synthase
MILSKIVKEKEKEIKERKEKYPLNLILKKINFSEESRNFKSAISKEGINLIAEIKKGSPSAGIIRKNFDHIEIAKIYEKGKVDAISVLTDEKFFKGNLDFLKDVKKITRVPILRKDFIIDEYQIYESKIFGADAILLIGKILEVKKLKKFLSLAKELKMDSLVEIHSENELKKILDLEIEIIGINNRNLENFKVDINTTFELLKKIPKDKIVVSESGIKKREDVIKLQNFGVNAILVGEVFMRSENILEKIKEIRGV